jgi:preprotein translocase subunit SecD
LQKGDGMEKRRSLVALFTTHTVVAMALSGCVPVMFGQNQDLQGGTQLMIELQKTPEITQITPQDLEAVKRVIEGRIHGLGISNSVVRTVGTDKILVQLPKIKDPQQAERVLGGTAQLEFRPQKPNTDTQLFALQASRSELKVKQKELQNSNDTTAIAKNKLALQKNNQALAQLFTSTNPPLTGKYLQDAYSEPTQGDSWHIGIRFNQEGGKLFTEVTKSLSGTGRAIGIFLDNELISSPTIGPEFAATGITGGAAVIAGRFTAQEANDLSVQLKGGALPIPVKIKAIAPNQ